MGSCVYGQVCVSVAGLRGGDADDAGRCVVPMAPIDSCEEAPEEWIGTDSGGCMICTCGTIDETVVISLECACC
jgi:hypothetical protein